MEGANRMFATGRQFPRPPLAGHLHGIIPYVIRK